MTGKRPFAAWVRARSLELGLPITAGREVAARNAGWLIGERLLSGLLGLTVTAAVARHLGPENFGILSFALSLVLLFGTLWTLGLAGLVVRELVRDQGVRSSCWARSPDSASSAASWPSSRRWH